jgi:hypothetical protein
LAGASTRSINASGFAFVHTNDAIDTFALPGVILYHRYNPFSPWWRG